MSFPVSWRTCQGKSGSAERRGWLCEWDMEDGGVTDKKSTPLIPPGTPFPIKRVILAALALSVVFAMAWLFIPRKLPPGISLADSWVFRENQTGPIIGDLGGVPVSIPKPYAHFVEYDGDPHFMEKRIGPPPPRTQNSKLASFGFEIRFPDMEPVTEKTKVEKKATTIQTTTWMRVGINSHSHYGTAGDESLDNYAARIAETTAQRRYEPLPKETYGLTGFAPVITDEARKKPAGDAYDRNIYIHRDKNGRVDTYIECSNRTHAAAPCEQYFNLRPDMRIQVSVGYRKGLLPQWREIQSSVTQVILGFRVNQTSNHNQN